MQAPLAPVGSLAIRNNVMENKEVINQNNNNNNFNIAAFIKLFIVFWLSTVALSPYFLMAMELSLVNSDFSFLFFHYLSNLISIAIVPLIIILLWRRPVPVADKMRNFVAANAKKVFSIGVISFYIILVVLIIFRYANIFEIFMNVVFSIIAFPISALMLSRGLNIFNKIININK